METWSSSKRTRILFLCHDGKIYGSQKSLQLMVAHLPRDRYELFVSFSKEGPLVDIFQDMGDVRVLFHQRIQGAKHSRRNGLRKIGDLASMALNTRRALDLARIIRKHRVDIVHTNSLVSFEGGLAAKLAGVPHVWHIRELFLNDNPRFQLTLGKRLTKRLVHHLSSRVLCISNQVRQQFEPFLTSHPRQYQVLNNAIARPENYIVPTGSRISDVLNLIYMGRISDGKRFQDVVDAFCILKTQWQGALPFQVYVYGEFISPDFESAMHAKIQANHLESCFHFQGYHTDLDACYTNIDLLLMPSSNEAFGRTLLEAMVRGVPVLAARSGGPVEIIDEGLSGFFHIPHSPEDLAACLTHVYRQRERLPEMRQYCLEQVRQRFDITQQIHQLDRIYQEILGKNLDAGIRAKVSEQALP